MARDYKDRISVRNAKYAELLEDEVRRLRSLGTRSTKSEVVIRALEFYFVFGRYLGDDTRERIIGILTALDIDPRDFARQFFRDLRERAALEKRNGSM